jgi:hypothetical protein
MPHTQHECTDITHFCQVSMLSRFEVLLQNSYCGQSESFKTAFLALLISGHQVLVIRLSWPMEFNAVHFQHKHSAQMHLQNLGHQQPVATSLPIHVNPQLSAIKFNACVNVRTRKCNF